MNINSNYNSISVPLFWTPFLYPGFGAGSKNIKTKLKHIKDVRFSPLPKDEGLRSLLGLVGYYPRFIKDNAGI